MIDPGQVSTGLDVLLSVAQATQQIADGPPWAAGDGGSGTAGGDEPASKDSILGLRSRSNAWTRRSRLVSSDPREDFIEQVWDRIAAKVATLAPAPSDRPLLKSDQLAARLGVSTVTVTKYRKRGMPCLNLGRSYRYDLAACVEWIRGRAA